MNLDKKKLAIVSLALSSFIAGVIAGYVWYRLTVPFVVKEPLELTDWPETIELYAGVNKTFEFTVNNLADVKYLVTMTFTLSDPEYQEAYVTFSDITYVVEPGENTLTAWVYVDGGAPPAELKLTIEFARATYTG